MNNNYFQNTNLDENSRIIGGISGKDDRNFNDNEKSISDILNMNKGKLANIYMSYYNSKDNVSENFSGVIESSSYDHAIISDPKTGKWTILPLMYLDYIEFEESVNFN